MNPGFSLAAPPHSRKLVFQYYTTKQPIYTDSISERNITPPASAPLYSPALKIPHLLISGKSLDCHIHRGPICQLLECGSTKTLSCIRRIAECSPEYSGFSKYLTIPLNRIKSQPPVHLLIFRNVIISSGLIWNELFIQTD